MWAFSLEVLLSSGAFRVVRPATSLGGVLETRRLARGEHGFPSVSPTTGGDDGRRRGPHPPVCPWRVVLFPGAALTKYH